MLCRSTRRCLLSRCTERRRARGPSCAAAHAPAAASTSMPPASPPLPSLSLAPCAAAAPAPPPPPPPPFPRRLLRRFFGSPAPSLAPGPTPALSPARSSPSPAAAPGAASPDAAPAAACGAGGGGGGAGRLRARLALRERGVGGWCLHQSKSLESATVREWKGARGGKGRDAREGRGEVERGGRDDDEHEGRVLAAGSAGEVRRVSEVHLERESGSGTDLRVEPARPESQSRATRSWRICSCSSAVGSVPCGGAGEAMPCRSNESTRVYECKGAGEVRRTSWWSETSLGRAATAGSVGAAVEGGGRVWRTKGGQEGVPRCERAKATSEWSDECDATRTGWTAARGTSECTSGFGCGAGCAGPAMLVVLLACESRSGASRSSRARTESRSRSLPHHPRGLHLHLRELTQCAMPDSGHPANSPTHPSSPPAPLVPAASVPPRHPLLAPPGHPGPRAPPPSTQDADLAPPTKRRRTLDPPPPSPAPAPAPPPRRPHSPFALSLAGPFAAHSLALASDFAPAVDAASALGALPAAAEQPHSVEPAPPLPPLGGALVASGADSLSVPAHEEDKGINALGTGDGELKRENKRAALEELEHVKNGASSSLSLAPPMCKS